MQNDKEALSLIYVMTEASAIDCNQTHIHLEWFLEINCKVGDTYRVMEVLKFHFLQKLYS